MSKKSYIWPFLFLVLFITIHQQEVYGKPPPKHGIIREFYSNGRLHLEFRYKRGRIVLKRAWYRNGRLMLDYRYHNGEPYRKKDYYDNGRLKSVWHKKTGVLKFFHDNGKLKAVVHSRADGLYH